MDRVIYELVPLSKADDVFTVAPNAVVPVEMETPPTQDLMYNGLELVVEVQGGNSVEKTGKDGKKWYFYTPHHYGYIKDTPSMEHGEEMDFFLNPKSVEGRGEPVYVAQLIMPDGSFNEEKVFLGFTSAAEVKTAFYQVYSQHDGYSCIVFAMTLDHFGKYINARQGEWKGEDIEADPDTAPDLIIVDEVPVVEVDLGANEGVPELTDLSSMIMEEALVDDREFERGLERSVTVAGREELLRKCRELRFLGANILKETREGPMVKATFSNEFGTGAVLAKSGVPGFTICQGGRTNAVGYIVITGPSLKETYDKVINDASLLKSAGLWNTDEHLLKVRSDKMERASKGATWLRKAKDVVEDTDAEEGDPREMEALYGRRKKKRRKYDEAFEDEAEGRNKEKEDE